MLRFEQKLMDQIANIVFKYCKAEELLLDAYSPILPTAKA